MRLLLSEKEFLEETRKVNEHWGDRMPLMAAEEAAEYIQAISKVERRLRDPRDWDYDEEIDHLAEEMGDVLITIGALMNRYTITFDEIEDAIDKKLKQEREV